MMMMISSAKATPALQEEQNLSVLPLYFALLLHLLFRRRQRRYLEQLRRFLPHLLTSHLQGAPFLSRKGLTLPSISQPCFTLCLYFISLSRLGMASLLLLLLLFLFYFILSFVCFHHKRKKITYITLTLLIFYLFFPIQ